MYGSKYTESIEINGSIRQFKLEPSEYCDKLLEESRIEIIEEEILNCIFSTFAEESLEAGIEKIIAINNDIINSLDNDISVIDNKYNISFTKIENIKCKLYDLKRNLLKLLIYLRFLLIF